MSLTPRFPVFLHGGDYNPDQWLKYPDVLEEDVRLMKEAKVNCVSLGIFAWAALEPEEGRYEFGWMDAVIDRLWKAGIRVDLATPSGARPAWMAQKYPEVLRVDDRFQRRHFGGRHNHCPSSPVYREKVRAIDTALAERYAKHPGVILWHISNEFSGDCYCPLCQEKWRAWLREKYGTLEALNDRWWTGFWSMAYTDWSQIEPPSPVGQDANPAMWVDWRRFSTHQCKNFILMEKEAVHSVCPEIPVTANLMQRFFDYDYFDLSEALDVVSWDSYPGWGLDDVKAASEHAMTHDLMRSFKDRPFLLMESTPSLVNWQEVNRVKRPGMHLLSSMLPLAHGSQSVMYFQWRKGRGGSEMFHGAVVGHDGTADTRVFKEVRQVGEALEKLAPLYGAPQEKPRVCILYDYSCLWALHYAQMGSRAVKDYPETVNAWYRALWKMGVAVDFRDMREETDLSGYALVIAPTLFMFRGGIEEKLRRFTEQGGTLAATYGCGVIDGDGRAFLSLTPHALTDVFGAVTEELDVLYPSQSNAMIMDGREWPVTGVCEVIRTEGAEVLGTYRDDFYAGRPCLTRNRFGKGEAWYLAARTDEAALTALLDGICRSLGIPRALSVPLPEGVVARDRGGCVFLQNYSGREQTVTLPDPRTDLLTGASLSGEITLPVCGVMALARG